MASLFPTAPATTVAEAVAAADELGYPCVVKAQVLIGGRGKAGGIKLAKDRAEAEEHANAILGMDIRASRSTSCGSRRPREIARSTTPRSCSTAARESRW